MMKLFKTLAVAGMFLLIAAGLNAQQPGEIHQTKVDSISGKAGKVILFTEYFGIDYTRLSANGKYIYGGTDETAEEAGASFIYEIATGKSKYFDDCVVGEVIDFDNYVTSKSIVRNGQEIEYDTKGLSCGTPIYASQDLNTIVMMTYIARMGTNDQGVSDLHRLYTSVVFDGTGKIIDTMPHYEANLTTGHGSLLWGLSPDGKIGVGKSSRNGAFSNNSPAFWDREIDKVFSLAIMNQKKTDGTLNGVSEDGTYMTGEREQIAIYLTYDRQTHADPTVYEIAPEPGYSISDGVSVQSKVVLGFDQRENTDVYGRKAWLYFIDGQRKVFLDEYIVNLYGLQMEPAYSMFTPGNLSKDLRVITGTTYDHGSWLPYVILLNEQQIYALPRAVSVRQPRNTVNAEIRWQEALKGDYTVKEYLIYRDSVQINSVSATAAENYVYTDLGVSAGEHYYQVQAVYTDGGVSDYSEKIKIQIVGEGECLPVREISANVVYNRTVDLYWGLPSSIVNKTNAARIEPGRKSVVRHAAPATKNAAKYTVKQTLDKISLLNTNIESASAAALVGDYLYVTDYRSNSFTIFNTLSGEKVAGVELGIGFVYDMIYHNNIFYIVGYNERVYEIRVDANDPTKLSVSNSWTVADKNARLSHIAYINGENGAEDMLMLGSYSNLSFYKVNGSGDTVEGNAALVKRFDISGLSISGSAYHKGRLYLANQAEAGHTPMVEVYDFKTGEHLFSSNLAEAFPELATIASYPTYDLSMAGLTVGTLEDGTVVLECMTQPLVDYNYVAAVEIESSPDIAGYNVFRDGKAVNDTNNPLKSRHLSEELLTPGIYHYSVQYVAANGCKKMSDNSDRAEVQIFEIGNCAAPQTVEAIETNKMAVVSWEWPDVTTSLVGFNVYRDGEKVADMVLEEKYVDQSVEKGEHIYRVEAFYDNSCMASDSVKITVNYEGKMMPPSSVHVTYAKEANKETNTHTTAWELPFFEEPMALGYGGISGQGAGFDGTNTLYAAIGWLASDMGTFDDLYLVGMEFVLAAEVASWSAVVYVDNQQVYNQPINDIRQRPRIWQRTFFSQSFPMKQKEEIAVGYMVNLKAVNDPVLAFDAGPAVEPGKSDLISPDGVSFYSAARSGVNANISINALVVRKRDLENAAKTSDPQAYIESKVMSVSSTPARLTSTQPIQNVKSTSESYTLKGFNVYRGEEKLNETLLTDTKFVETDMAVGEYEYQVSAVYAEGEEFSSIVVVNTRDVANQTNGAVCPVAFYPNPVLNSLNIKGEYESLQLVDITGRVLMDNVGYTQTLDMSALKSGVYFINFTAAGNRYTVKIVKK